MKSRFRAFVVALLAMPFSVLGQGPDQGGYVYQTGSPTFSTQYPIEHGYINVNNGDVHLEIPIAGPPQRGGILGINARLVYDSRIWKINPNGSSYMWQPNNIPNSMGGWTILLGGETGSAVTSTPYTYSNTYEGGVDQSGHLSYCNNTQQTYSNFAWTDAVGTTHAFHVTWNEQNWPCEYQNGYDVGNGPQSTYGYAADGSGLVLSMSGYQGSSPDALAYTITDRNGTQIYTSTVDQNGNRVSGLIVDRNGNKITQDANGNPVDTFGNTPVIRTDTGNQIDLAVLGMGGNRAHYTITTEQVAYSTKFLETGVTDISGSFTTVQSIQLPDGSQYTFSYDTTPSADGQFHPYYYGDLTSMTLPTGGVVQYGYFGFQDSFQNLNRWLHTYTADGGTATFTPTTLSQCSSSQGCQESTTLKSPAGDDTIYNFTLDKGQVVNGGSWATEVAAYQGASGNGKKLVDNATSYTYNTVDYANPQTGRTDTLEQAVAYTTRNTLADAGVASQSTTAFDPNTGYTHDVKTWDYQSGAFPSQPDRDTIYTYTGTYPLFLQNVTTQDGAGNPLSKVSYDYDSRGNQSGQHQWINTTGGTFDTGITYDGAGTPKTSTAPEGMTTYTPDATDTFMAALTPPTPSSGAKLTSSTSYDSATGAVTSITDPNGQATLYKGFDMFNRPQELDFADGGKTMVAYPSPTLVNESTAFNTTGSGTTMKQNDAYGRPSRTAVATGQGNTFYQQDICYDTSGRVNFQSYRYQGPGFSAAKVCSGAGDSYTYDAFGRTRKVTHGDGTAINYNYTGRAVEVTDENNVSRITQTDAFGRTTIACEVSSDATMPASGSPAGCGTDIAATGFTTTYSYNPAAFQTTVTQGAQTRKFTTDSLGRQVAAQEPESGQTGWNYAYNATGLLVTRTKPRANQTNPTVLTTTQTQYDTLGRILSVNYSDGTGAKTYGYDAPYPGTNAVNTLGRLTQQIAQTAAGQSVQAYSYDPLGRTAQVFTCTPSTCGQSIATQNYGYDYAGNLIGSTDGAGAVLNYTYTPANETTGVKAEGGGYPATLVSNVVQGPFGPTSYQLGNGLSQVYGYDGLGRRNGGWLCVGSTGQGCTNGTERYGYTVTYGGARINQACDTVLGNCAVMNYDDFSRLRGRSTTSGTALNDSWTYDRYGNRWTQTAAPSGYQQQISVDPTTNHAVGFGYDAAGNLTADANHSYNYDAEGNLLAVDGGGTAKYYYDASNLRVRTDLGSLTYDLLFDLQGHKTAIMSGSNVVEEDTRLDGRPLALLLSGNLVFEHQDWLGTERLLTAGDGTESGSYTSNPFGDVFGDQGADLDPYHYAGLDHDYETGLEHAQFREYASAGGRWMSPDPYAGSYDWSNPQSLNRYSYALNDPQSLSDPLGLDGEGGVSGIGSLGGCVGAVAQSGGDPYSDVACGLSIFKELLGLFGPGPSFHGSLKPRPNAQPWDEGNIIYGPNIAGALGLPDDTCEFGPCDPAIMNATGNSQIGSASATIQKIKIYFAFGYGLAQAALKANGYCSEGVFGYAGAQQDGFAGYLGNADTQSGFSNDFLVEMKNRGFAVGGEGAEGIYFAPFSKFAGGLFGVSKAGTTVGAYVGTPETKLLGLGLGAYTTVSFRKHCTH